LCRRGTWRRLGPSIGGAAAEQWSLCNGGCQQTMHRTRLPSDRCMSCHVVRVSHWHVPVAECHSVFIGGRCNWRLQTSFMEALESVTQGINRLLEFEYKKVHELKFQLYEVDKKRREKRVEVGRLYSRWMDRRRRYSVLQCSTHTRPQVEGMQKKKDAGKEVDEQVHNRARPGCQTSTCVCRTAPHRTARAQPCALVPIRSKLVCLSDVCADSALYACAATCRKCRRADRN
jgi:hypothetical protein